MASQVGGVRPPEVSGCGYLDVRDRIVIGLARQIGSTLFAE